MAQNIFTTYYSLHPDGVWRNDLGRPAIPSDVEKAGFEITDAHRKAYEDYLEETTRVYAEAQAKMTPEQEAEYLSELRAAFGPGEEIVDVITGKRYFT